MAIANADTGFKVTGPVHHYVRVPVPYVGVGTTSAVSGIYYLGTCEVQPQIDIQKVSIPVKNDIGGRMLPTQSVYQGQMAQVGMALNRFSLSALALIKNTGIGGINLGTDQSQAVGALEFGNLTFELWQINGFFNWSTPVTGPSAITCGYYWPNVKLVHEVEQKTGTVDETKLLVCEAYKQLNCTTGIYSGLLYSQDYTSSTYFPTDVRVPPCF